jgi:intein/homing endonuclease
MDNEAPGLDRAFDDMGGRFQARLKALRTLTKSSTGTAGTFEATTNFAVLEAKFDLEVLDRLNEPCFIALERDSSEGKVYLVYEVFSVAPMHFQMLGVSSSIPLQIREEFLDRVSESWSGSVETWIDVSAVATGYRLKVDGDALSFDRSRLIPLYGSKAHLLSNQSVSEFICVKGGIKIGKVAGFNIDLKVDPDALARYHVGLFGFSVDHDEPILFREGGTIRMAKVGTLVDRYFDEGGQGRAPVSGIQVVAFDPLTLEVKWSPLQYVFRHRFEGRLLRFGLQTGTGVSVTPGHSLFVLRGGGIRCVPAQIIRPGDLVVGAHAVAGHDGEKLSIDLLEEVQRLGMKGLTLVGIPDGSYDGIPRMGAPDCQWCRWRRNGVLPLKYLESLAAENRDAVKLAYKGLRIPVDPHMELDEPLARFLGYFVARGHANFVEGKCHSIEFTFGPDDDETMEDLRAIVETKFGNNVVTRGHGAGSRRFKFSNKVLAGILRDWAGGSAPHKRVPQVILNSPSRVRRAFLEAWSRGDPRVSSSSELLDGVRYLLLMEGCVATVSPMRMPSTSVIEGTVVAKESEARVVTIPRAADAASGTWGPSRLKREPKVPTSHAPGPLRGIGSRSSYVDRRTLNLLDGKSYGLASYYGRPSEDSYARRRDDLYRTDVAGDLTKGEGKVYASQALELLGDEIGSPKCLADSHFSFLEVRSVEEVEPTSKYVYDVSVPGAENFLAGSGGVFCHNTGTGKSNLTANLVRKLMALDETLKVCILDVSGEYPVHLADMLGSSQLFTSEDFGDDIGIFAQSQVVPETLEARLGGAEWLTDIFKRLHSQGRIKVVELAEIGKPWNLEKVYGVVSNIAADRKSGYLAAERTLQELQEHFAAKGLARRTEVAKLPKEEVDFIVEELTSLKGKVHSMSGAVKDIEEAVEIVLALGTRKEVEAHGTPEDIAYQLLTGKDRLFVIYTPDPEDARITATRFLDRLLYLKKISGMRQKVLVVLDEAQEFAPGDPRGTAIESSRAVEALLRQGRKYRAFALISTQRVARMNTNALQQLHSYFVSTLPRSYDRIVIAESFSLDFNVLEKTSQLSTGEWLFVSYKATRQRNVPVFIRAENNEDAVSEFARSKA